MGKQIQLARAFLTFRVAMFFLEPPMPPVIKFGHGWEHDLSG